MTVSSHPSSRLHDKVAIITGSSSGIGRAIAIAYAREGAKVVCADVTENARPEIDQESRVSTYGLIQKMGGDCLFVKTNVAEEKDLQELMEQTIARYGRLDMSVKSIGILTYAASSKNLVALAWSTMPVSLLRLVESTKRHLSRGSK